MNTSDEIVIPLSEPHNNSTNRKSSLLSAQLNSILPNEKSIKLQDSCKIDIVTNPTDDHLFNNLKELKRIKPGSLRESASQPKQMRKQTDSVIEVDINEDVENCEEAPFSRNSSIRRRQKNERDPNVETVL